CFFFAAAAAGSADAVTAMATAHSTAENLPRISSSLSQPSRWHSNGLSLRVKMARIGFAIYFSNTKPVYGMFMPLFLTDIEISRKDFDHALASAGSGSHHDWSSGGRNRICTVRGRSFCRP